MLSFDYQKKRKKNGRRPFKAVLHEGVSRQCCRKTMWGRSSTKMVFAWIEQYCKENIESAKGMSINRPQFIDNDETGTSSDTGSTKVEDGIPVFKDATIIGNAERAYLDTVEINGEMKACFSC